MTEDKITGWHHQLNGHESGKLWELVMDREAWCAGVHGIFQARVLEWGAIAFSNLATKQQQSRIIPILSII